MTPPAPSPGASKAEPVLRARAPDIEEYVEVKCQKIDESIEREQELRTQLEALGYLD